MHSSRLHYRRGSVSQPRFDAHATAAMQSPLGSMLLQPPGTGASSLQSSLRKPWDGPAVGSSRPATGDDIAARKLRHGSNPAPGAKQVVMTPGLVSEAERSAFFAETPRSAQIAALWAPPPRRKTGATPRKGFAVNVPRSSGAPRTNGGSGSLSGTGPRPQTSGPSWQSNGAFDGANSIGGSGGFSRGTSRPSTAAAGFASPAAHRSVSFPADTVTVGLLPRPASVGGPAQAAREATMQRLQPAHAQPSQGEPGYVPRIVSAWGAGDSLPAACETPPPQYHHQQQQQQQHAETSGGEAFLSALLPQPAPLQGREKQGQMQLHNPPLRQLWQPQDLLSNASARSNASLLQAQDAQQPAQQGQQRLQNIGEDSPSTFTQLARPDTAQAAGSRDDWPAANERGLHVNTTHYHSAVSHAADSLLPFSSPDAFSHASAQHSPQLQQPAECNRMAHHDDARINMVHPVGSPSTPRIWRQFGDSSNGGAGGSAELSQQWQPQLRQQQEAETPRQETRSRCSEPHPANGGAGAPGGRARLHTAQPAPAHEVADRWPRAAPPAADPCSPQWPGTSQSERQLPAADAPTRKHQGALPWRWPVVSGMYPDSILADSVATGSIIGQSSVTGDNVAARSLPPPSPAQHRLGLQQRRAAADEDPQEQQQPLMSGWLWKARRRGSRRSWRRKWVCSLIRLCSDRGNM